MCSDNNIEQLCIPTLTMFKTTMEIRAHTSQSRLLIGGPNDTNQYSNPWVLQPSSYFKTTLDYKTALFGPKGQFSVLNDLYFKTICNIRPHFLVPWVVLK